MLNTTTQKTNVYLPSLSCQRYCLGTVGRKTWAWVVPPLPLKVNPARNQHRIKQPPTNVCTCPAIVLYNKLWMLISTWCRNVNNNKPECALRLLLAKSCPVVDEEGWSSHTVSLVWRMYIHRIILWHISSCKSCMFSLFVLSLFFHALRFVIYLCDWLGAYEQVVGHECTTNQLMSRLQTWQRTTHARWLPFMSG